MSKEMDMVRRLAMALAVTTATLAAAAAADHVSAGAAPKGGGGGNQKNQTCTQHGGGGKNSPHTVTCVGVISLGGILSNDTININNNSILSPKQLNILSNDVVSHNYLTVVDIQDEVVSVYKNELNILNITDNDVTVITCALGVIC
jgi:hypothetical protein